MTPLMNSGSYAANNVPTLNLPSLAVNESSNLLRYPGIAEHPNEETEGSGGSIVEVGGASGANGKARNGEVTRATPSSLAGTNPKGAFQNYRSHTLS